MTPCRDPNDGGALCGLGKSANWESWDGSEGDTKQCERDGEVGEECWVKNNTATVGKSIP